MKRVLLVYHSQTAGAARMANAVAAGVRSIEEVELVFLRAFDASVDDVLAADAYLFGTPENFGYMSGALKDFFDRVYYPCEGRLEGRPYALFVNAGLDGQGAVMNVERIAAGLRLKRAAAPVVALKGVTPSILERCAELGGTLAAGVAFGIL
jgi:multimeric flavodoxin WrbA